MQCSCYRSCCTAEGPAGPLGLSWVMTCPCQTQKRKAFFVGLTMARPQGTWPAKVCVLNKPGRTQLGWRYLLESRPSWGNQQMKTCGPPGITNKVDPLLKDSMTTKQRQVEVLKKDVNSNMLSLGTWEESHFMASHHGLTSLLNQKMVMLGRSATQNYLIWRTVHFKDSVRPLAKAILRNSPTTTPFVQRILFSHIQAHKLC